MGSVNDSGLDSIVVQIDCGLIKLNERPCRGKSDENRSQCYPATTQSLWCAFSPQIRPSTHTKYFATTGNSVG